MKKVRAVSDAWMANDRSVAERMEIQIVWHAFQGAIDGLRINTEIFAFEPFGVVVTVAP